MQEKKPCPLDPANVHFRTDEQGKILSASHNLSDYTGKKNEDLIGSSVKRILASADARRLPELLKNLPINPGNTILLSVKGKRRTRKFLVSLHKKRHGIDWKLKVQRESLVSLKEDPAHLNWLRESFGAVPQPVIIFHAATFRIVFANQAATQLYGYTQREFSNLPVLRLYTREAAEDMHERGVQPGVCVQMKKNGQRVRLQLSVNTICIHNVIHQLLFVNHAVETPPGVDSTWYPSAVFENVLISNSLDGTILLDETGMVTYAAPSVKNILGYSPEEITGQNCFAYVHPDDEEIATRAFLDELKMTPSAQYYEMRFRNNLGNWVWMLVRGHNLLDDQHIKAMVIYFTDITRSKESEIALRESEKRFRNLADAAPVMIWVSDENDQTTYVNHSWSAFTGLYWEEVIGNGWFKVVHPDDVEAATTKGRAFFERRKPVFLEYRMKSADGSYRWVIDYGVPRFLEDGRFLGYIGSVMDIHDRRAAEGELRRNTQKLTEYSERLTNILDSITDGFIVVDRELKVSLWNQVAEKLTGIKALDIIGKSIPEAFPKWIETNGYQDYSEALEKKQTVRRQHYIHAIDRWFDASAYPSRQGLFIYFRDITESKKQDQLLKLEKEVLALNAQASVPLKVIVDYFLEGMETIFPGMLCSLLTLHEDGQRIRPVSAPSLPAAFSDAIDGLLIGPRAGSCGTAMYRKERVISGCIPDDPLWEGYRHLAAEFGLQACWSFPILNAQNQVLATIAAYFHYERLPMQREIDLLERVANFFRIIMENKEADTKIRISNERYLLATKAANDAIWDWDVATNMLYWGDGFFTLFGHKPGNLNNSFQYWEERLHPDDRERVIRGLEEFMKSVNLSVWQEEYRFRKADGSYAIVADRAFLIFNREGEITRMVGSMQDITARRELEKKVLNQELMKQKLVAQTVVDAQEKERAEIGKELHDNVNQVLSTAKLYLELAGNDGKESSDLIKRSARNISEAINEIRSITRSLVPASIGDLGLIESIQDLVENVRATKKIQVELCHRGEIDRIIKEKQKLMLFRIIQEQVSNVLRHSGASRLDIELVAGDDLVELTVKDDGKGFDPDLIRNKKGVGLYNIANRAELFNGRVNIITAPGMGCKLNIQVPISNL